MRHRLYTDENGNRHFDEFEEDENNPRESFGNTPEDSTAEYGYNNWLRAAVASYNSYRGQVKSALLEGKVDPQGAWVRRFPSETKIHQTRYEYALEVLRYKTGTNLDLIDEANLGDEEICRAEGEKEKFLKIFDSYDENLYEVYQDLVTPSDPMKSLTPSSGNDSKTKGISSRTIVGGGLTTVAALAITFAAYKLYKSGIVQKMNRRKTEVKNRKKAVGEIRALIRKYKKSGGQKIEVHGMKYPGELLADTKIVKALAKSPFDIAIAKKYTETGISDDYILMFGSRHFVDGDEESIDSKFPEYDLNILGYVDASSEMAIPEDNDLQHARWDEDREYTVIAKKGITKYKATDKTEQIVKIADRDITERLEIKPEDDLESMIKSVTEQYKRDRDVTISFRDLEYGPAKEWRLKFILKNAYQSTAHSDIAKKILSALGFGIVMLAISTVSPGIGSGTNVVTAGFPDLLMSIENSYLRLAGQIVILATLTGMMLSVRYSNREETPSSKLEVSGVNGRKRLKKFIYGLIFTSLATGLLVAINSHFAIVDPYIALFSGVFLTIVAAGGLLYVHSYKFRSLVGQVIKKPQAMDTHLGVEYSKDGLSTVDRKMISLQDPGEHMRSVYYHNVLLHIINVRHLTVQSLKRLKEGKADWIKGNERAIRVGALLHDWGKSDPELLNIVATAKEDPSDLRRLVRRHPYVGGKKFEKELDKIRNVLAGLSPQEEIIIKTIIEFHGNNLTKINKDDIREGINTIIDDPRLKGFTDNEKEKFLEDVKKIVLLIYILDHILGAQEVSIRRYKQFFGAMPPDPLEVVEQEEKIFADIALLPRFLAQACNKKLGRDHFSEDMMREMMLNGRVQPTVFGGESTKAFNVYWKEKRMGEDEDVSEITKNIEIADCSDFFAREDLQFFGNEQNKTKKEYRTNNTQALFAHVGKISFGKNETEEVFSAIKRLSLMETGEDEISYGDEEFTRLLQTARVGVRSTQAKKFHSNFLRKAKVKKTKNNMGWEGWIGRLAYGYDRRQEEDRRVVNQDGTPPEIDEIIRKTERRKRRRVLQPFLKAANHQEEFSYLFGYLYKAIHKKTNGEISDIDLGILYDVLVSLCLNVRIGKKVQTQLENIIEGRGTEKKWKNTEKINGVNKQFKKIAKIALNDARKTH